MTLFLWAKPIATRPKISYLYTKRDFYPSLNRPAVRKIAFLITLFSCLLCYSQRGKTGDRTFADRFPEDVTNEVSNAKLTVRNTVDHDVIVCLRNQTKNYLRHVYIRNGEEFTFDRIPITRLYVQFKSKEFFFEEKSTTNINFGENHTFTFFYDASMEGNYIQITEEEFFRP